MAYKIKTRTRKEAQGNDWYASEGVELWLDCIDCMQSVGMADTDRGGLPGKPLQRPDGTPVALTRSGMDFVVTIGDQVVSQTSSNAQTCYVLNQAEVGLSV